MEVSTKSPDARGWGLKGKARDKNSGTLVGSSSFADFVQLWSQLNLRLQK